VTSFGNLLESRKFEKKKKNGSFGGRGAGYELGHGFVSLAFLSLTFIVYIDFACVPNFARIGAQAVSLQTTVTPDFNAHLCSRHVTPSDHGLGQSFVDTFVY